MTNPATALPSFQEALDAQELAVRRSKTDASLYLTMDQTADGVRLTYFRAQGEIAIGICSIIQNGFHNGLVCFGLGYAVVEAFRRQGRGSELVGAAVKDHIAGMNRAGVKSLYIEAVVDATNVGSQRIAARHLGQDREEIIDRLSGLPAYRYTLGVGIEP